MRHLVIAAVVLPSQSAIETELNGQARVGSVCGQGGAVGIGNTATVWWSML